MSNSPVFSRKVDMHTHIMPRDIPDFASEFGYDGFIQLDHHRPGFARMMQGDTFFREVASNCWDPVERIEEYESHGTTVQVVCTIPVLFAYFAEPQDGLQVARFLNNDLMTTVSSHPRRYIGLGTLPMQAPDLAIKELERCKNIGLRGVQIGSNINGANLDQANFFAVFEAAQDLDMAVFVHPWNMMGKPEMERYWLPWLVGMPAESSRAACSLIFGGVLERLPKLKVCLAHAGGSFLPTLGRIRHGFACRPDLVAIDNPVDPVEYLGKFWIDSITHDPKLLRYVLDLVGDNRVMLGSDYPFPLGDLEIGAFIEEMGLTKQTVERIFRTNALEWLGVDDDDFD